MQYTVCVRILRIELIAIRLGTDTHGAQEMNPHVYQRCSVFCFLIGVITVLTDYVNTDYLVFTVIPDLFKTIK